MESIENLLRRIASLIKSDKIETKQLYINRLFKIINQYDDIDCLQLKLRSMYFELKYL